MDQPERPIRTSERDALDRGEFVRRLADSLVHAETGKATGVVIGVTGPWGSGKSSILNLLREHLQERYPNSVIVSFDPWLVSGRNDLISEFVAELLASIRTEPKLRRKLKGLTKTIVQYGAHLAPTANLLLPGAGVAAQGGLKAAEAWLIRDEGLTRLRARLLDELAALSVSVVVLVDEVDRVEDSEIRAVAQLVRSVVDFPGISYVLAYDADRVVEALGSGAPPDKQVERGRSYLEKIVQLQIPLPFTFIEERTDLLIAEIAAMQSEVYLPDGFRDDSDFNRLVEILVSEVVTTPRDIKRLTASFRALSGMVGREVNPVDLIAYCALLTKAPATVSQIRQSVDVIADDAITFSSIRFDSRNLTEEQRLDNFIPDYENNIGVRRLMLFPFPFFSGGSGSRFANRDSLRFRRPLMTTLRLGLPPGVISRTEIESFLKNDKEKVVLHLRQATLTGGLTKLIDRVDDVYSSIGSSHRIDFWNGVVEFLHEQKVAFRGRQKVGWLRAFDPIANMVEAFAALLRTAVGRNPSMRPIAADTFEYLCAANEEMLTPLWLYRHFFDLGIFGVRHRESIESFLSREVVEGASSKRSQTGREQHLSGTLLPELSNLYPVYILSSIGYWDEDCQDALTAALAQDEAVDGMAILLFGGNYVTDDAYIAKICSLEIFKSRVRERLLPSNTPFDRDPSLGYALNRAIGRS